MAATSARDPAATAALQVYLADKRLVVTAAVLAESLAGSAKAAGTVEKGLIAALLARIDVIPNDPSARVMALKADSQNKKKILGPVDRIAFGTGDKLGITTVSTDAKFVAEASKQGVNLNVTIIRPIPYATR